jgi:hypothetical protein
MFQLTREEANALLSSRVFQNGTPGYNYSAYTPFAFTEQGVAMLSSVLRNDIAVKVNISIMRAFVVVRQYMLENEAHSKEITELRNRINALEKQGEKTLKIINELGEDTLSSINELSEDLRNEIDDIYLALTELSDKKSKEKSIKPIGFITYEKDK